MPAADRIFDLDTPYPKAVVEGLRKGIKAALSKLEQAIEDVQASQAGVDDAYFLTDLLFDLLDGSLEAVEVLTARVDDLAARLTALEPATEAPDQPDLPPTDLPEEPA